MKHILFIINPHAGQKTVEEFENALHAEMRKLSDTEAAAVKIETMIPESPEQMRVDLREKFSEKPVDILGVVGGDGTIMEALPLLIEFPGIKLALVPYGTGNLLAANLDIPNQFSDCLDTLFNGKPRRIDLAKINDSYFCLIAGVGVVADIMDNTPRAHKKKLGMLAYLLNGIRTVWGAKRGHFLVKTENRTFKGKGVAVVVSNAASFLGPCIPLTPDAEPDDGLLDVCIIKSRSNADYFSTIMEVLLRPDASHLTQQNVVSFQTRHLRIETSRRMKVQADGNVIGYTPVEIEIIRNRLQVMVPASHFELSNIPEKKLANESSLLDTLACYLKTAKAEAGSGIK